MEILYFIFRLGVVLAIFSFIWGLINLGLGILRGGIPLSYPAKLSLKAIQYFLIVNLVVLFSFQDSDINVPNAIITGAIISMYFLGKVQRMKMRFAIIQIQGRNFNQPEKPKMGLEFGVIAFAMFFYVFLLFNFDYASNNVANWFYKSIVDIENTIFFGFIFKIIGFFFTVTIIIRMVNSINVLLTGGNKQNNNPDQENDNRFDDYEEVE